MKATDSHKQHEKFQPSAVWHYLWRFDRLLALSVMAYTIVLAATLAAGTAVVVTAPRAQD